MAPSSQEVVCGILCQGTSTEEYEEAVLKRDRAKYLLRLYVRLKSTQAIANVQKLCEKYLECLYEHDVIDICQQPNLAKEELIIATPMLIKKLPLPLRKLIGGMSDTGKFLVGINLKTKNSSTGNNEEKTTSH